eukprot:scaffold984_cov281-Chaetoceros_neogracile.AAC.15
MLHHGHALAGKSIQNNGPDDAHAGSRQYRSGRPSVHRPFERSHNMDDVSRQAQAHIHIHMRVLNSKPPFEKANLEEKQETI